MRSETIQLDEHEVVVDRDWLEGLSERVRELGDETTADEILSVSNAGIDEEEDDDAIR